VGETLTGHVTDGVFDARALHARFPGKYLSVTSFRRDGTGVATPVWFAIDGGRLVFQTDPQSFKARRIRSNPAVEIASCNAGGRLSGPRMTATAEFVDEGQAETVERLLADKYRVDRVIVMPIYRLIQRLRGRPVASESVALAITPLPSTPGPDSTAGS